MTELNTLAAAALIAAIALLVVVLVKRFAPTSRKSVGRITTLLALYFLALAAAWGLPTLVDPEWTRIARIVAEVVGFFTLVATVGVTVFDLILPLARIRVPTIAAELVMGAAYLVATFLVLRRFGLDPAGLLATSAILTAILALSLQATLGNVIGGVALQVDDSIQVGDWVQLQTGRQGLVREIRWRHTVIETRDWDTLIVPNAQLLAETITILGKRQGAPVQHRMWVYFNVDFRFSPADVIEAVESALCAAPIKAVATDPPPNCICYDFAQDGRDSMAYYAVRYWLTDLARDDPTSSLVRVRVFAALKRAEIPLAVPAAHIWVEQDSQKRRTRKLEGEMKRRRRAIRAVPFFEPLDDAEVDALGGRLRYAPFAAGETITHQGNVAHWLYLIIEGEAAVNIASDGETHTIATVAGPDVVGEMGLFTGEPRTASVVATTDIECYRLDKEAFRATLESRPELAAEISAVVAERQVRLESDYAEASEAASRRVEDEKARLLGAVSRFFGLFREDDS